MGDRSRTLEHLCERPEQAHGVPSDHGAALNLPRACMRLECPGGMVDRSHKRRRLQRKGRGCKYEHGKLTVLAQEYRSETGDRGKRRNYKKDAHESSEHAGLECVGVRRKQTGQSALD